MFLLRIIKNLFNPSTSDSTKNDVVVQTNLDHIELNSTLPPIPEEKDSVLVDHTSLVALDKMLLDVVKTIVAADNRNSPNVSPTSFFKKKENKMTNENVTVTDLEMAMSDFGQGSHTAQKFKH